MKRILFLSLVSCLLSFAAYGQSKTNTISRPCTGTTTSAKVWITKAGNVEITPCSGGTVTLSGVGVGNLTGPGSSTDNAIARWNGVTGLVLQDSAVTVADTNGKMTWAQGTLTTSNPFATHTATWNDGAVTFTNFFSNVTDTASAAASKLLDLQVGGATKFNIGKTGNTTITQGTLTTTAVPWLSHTATWNDGGTTHTGLFSNVTDTASAAASKLADFQVGGNTKFSVSKTGAITMAGSTSGTTVLTPTAAAGTTTATLPARTITVMGTDEVLRSYLASTVTYNNNAVLADTALSVSVAASGIYEVDLVVHSTSGASTSLSLDFGGTATIANFIGEWQVSDTAVAAPPAAPTLEQFRTTAAGTDVNSTNMDNTSSYWRFRGSVEITDAGTFLLRGAQRSAQAVNTTIIRGSTLTLTKMN